MKKKINEKELHELFYKLKIKDTMAYEDLYEKYSSLVYKIAFCILKNKENAEDIMQNVFIKIANLSEEKLPSKYEASWLYSVTKNEVISYIRKSKKIVPVEEIKENSKEDEIEQILQKDSYESLLSFLEEKEKQIITLKVEVGLSFKEIAQMLNMPIGTVQWKYYKSLHSLKLLIGNLSLFIITAGLCIRRLGTKQKEIADFENQNVEIEKQEISGILEDKEKLENAQANHRNEQISLENKAEEEIKQEIIVENKEEISILDIGLIGLSSIFLAFSIFFTIIFVNCQQTKRKNASKK